MIVDGDGRILINSRGQMVTDCVDVWTPGCQCCEHQIGKLGVTVSPTLNYGLKDWILVGLDRDVYPWVYPVYYHPIGVASDDDFAWYFIEVEPNDVSSVGEWPEFVGSLELPFQYWDDYFYCAYLYNSRLNDPVCRRYLTEDKVNFGAHYVDVYRIALIWLLCNNDGYGGFRDGIWQIRFYWVFDVDGENCGILYNLNKTLRSFSGFRSRSGVDGVEGWDWHEDPYVSYKFFPFGVGGEQIDVHPCKWQYETVTRAEQYIRDPREDIDFFGMEPPPGSRPASELNYSPMADDSEYTITIAPA